MVSNTAFEQAVLDALAAIKTDVASLKTDVASLKTDVASLKTDVAALKTDVASLNVRVDRLERETFSQFTSLARELQLLRHEFESFRGSVSMQLGAHDANFRDITMTLRELRTLHTSTTHMLELRISALELSP
jgi:predicted  nucleic acid-binding Zn-ribbon protein